MDGQKKVVEKLKDANNILVTVQSDPSIDALSACIGLTLLLNELGKHATAVFSGKVPHVLEFLQPEKTIETNTNSLRDFIISLDKSKADKLRYKVEDKVVKIFITPYKTSITDRDLEFSQGDFNVDVVIAIGVHDQSELDQAVTAHGRILHDATVLAINTTEGDNLGSVDWVDKEASSLSEMAASLVDPLAKDKLDNQIATAFLTGIVEQTERFSNNKTTPKTMSISAKLLTAGANQELVASKLAEPEPEPEPVEEPLPRSRDEEPAEAPVPVVPVPAPKKAEPGTLEIDHTHDESAPEPEPKPEPAPIPAPTERKEEPSGNYVSDSEPAEERDPFEEDGRRHKRIEPLPGQIKTKPELKLEDEPEEEPAPTLEIPNAHIEPSIPQTPPPPPAPPVADTVKPEKSEKPEVSDEAVSALRELQRARANKTQETDTEKAAREAAAEKAAEDYLRNKQINIDDQGHLRLMTPEHRQFLGDAHNNENAPATNGEKTAGEPDASKFVLSPPTLGGTLTANSRPDDSRPDQITDPMSMPRTDAPMLSHDAPPATPPSQPAPLAQLAGPEDAPAPAPAQKAVEEALKAAPSANSSHANVMAAAAQAMTAPVGPAMPEPLAQMDDGSSESAAPATDQGPDKPLDMPTPPSLNLPPPVPVNQAPSPVGAPGSPPPVPPPMMPPNQNQ